MRSNTPSHYRSYRQVALETANFPYHLPNTRYVPTIVHVKNKTICDYLDWLRQFKLLKVVIAFNATGN